MSDRHRLALRVIAGSGRAALEKARSGEERTEIATRIDDLLAELEAQVLREGADPELIEAIERERRRAHE